METTIHFKYEKYRAKHLQLNFSSKLIERKKTPPNGKTNRLSFQIRYKLLTFSPGLNITYPYNLRHRSVFSI